VHRSSHVRVTFKLKNPVRASFEPCSSSIQIPLKVCSNIV